MFDGNFRSTREVNLSGSSNRRRRTQQRLGSSKRSTTLGGGGTLPATATTTTSIGGIGINGGIGGGSGGGSGGGNSKQELLKNAEIQRKQRQEQQKRERSARLIQRMTRGHQGRLSVLQRFLQDTENPSAVSICLSLQQWISKISSNRENFSSSSESASASSSLVPSSSKQLLLEYAEVSQPPSASAPSSPTSLQQQQQQQQQQGEGQQQNYNSNNDSRWFSYRRLVQAAFAELTPQETDEMERQALLSILQSHLPLIPMTVPVFLSMTTCFQAWWQYSKESMTHTISTTLCQWSMEAATNKLPTTTTSTATATSSSVNKTPTKASLAKALLASIFLGTSSNAILKGNNQQTIYTTWFLPLADILQSNTTSNSEQNQNKNNDNKYDHDQKALIKAVLKNLQGGRERRVLSNILDIQAQQTQDQQQRLDPRPIVQLIHHVLSQDDASSTTNTTSRSTGSSNTGDITLLTSLLARGDMLEQTTPAAAAAQQSEWGDDDAMDEDDEDEDNDDDENENNRAQQQQLQDTKKPKSSPRYTRRDLLTIFKLDKIYQDQIQQLKKQQRDTTSSSQFTQAKDLANKIVNAPWLQWGLAVSFGNEAENETGNETDSETETETEDDSVMARSFVEVLARMLQATTSLRPSARLNVLSPVAFSRPFLVKLWNYAKQSESLLALSVFCDLFAHYLVALSDVNFIQYHTNAADNGSTGMAMMNTNMTKSVMAEDIIVHLRNVLYELYWSKPVLAAEIDRYNERGRVFLAGTKVWNSLYERWNRLLLRRPFCDESAWWFPHMSSKEGIGAVLPDEQEGEDDQHDHHDDDDSMDIDDDDDANPNRGLSAAEAETDALADTFRDPKMARVLTCIPQALPFDRRVKLFHSLLKADKRKALNAAIHNRAMARMRMQDDDMFFGNIREQVKIRRAALYQDSMDQLNSMGPRLKHQVQVSFINQHGAEEAGIDGGGVFKEFLDDLIKDGFAVKDETSNAGAPPLFAVTPLQTLAVNFDMAEAPGILSHYEFVGRVLGKAVYESILVEPQFCLPFLNQLLAKPNMMEDLKNYDEEYYKNLTKLRQLNEVEIDSLGLTFELTVSSGSTPSTNSPPRTVELVPGGRSIPVTKKNVFQYIHLVAHQLLNVQGARQTRAFLKGFRDLIPASWVRLFSANELQKLISGDDSVRGIDVQSLKKSMHYLGGYHSSQPYIQDFWDILEKEFTPEQQRKFLRFMTSCSRQPLLGFTSLDPVPSIQQIRLNEDELSRNSKLPTSQTCMNLLKLPNYKSRQLLKEKLLAAIESGAGFELT